MAVEGSASADANSLTATARIKAGAAGSGSDDHRAGPTSPLTMASLPIVEACGVKEVGLGAHEINKCTQWAWHVATARVIQVNCPIPVPIPSSGTNCPSATRFEMR